MFKSFFPTVRIKQFISNPLYMYTWLMRQIFYKKDSFGFSSKYTNIKQIDENETLAHIIKNNMSIIRYGDGEFGLLTGAGIYCGIKKEFLKFNWCQKYSKKLKMELIRILGYKNKSIMIAFPPIAHIIHNERKGPLLSHKELVHSNMHIEARMLLWKYIHNTEVYGSWSVFMPQHNATLNWNSIYEYIKNKTIVIVTGNTHKLENVKLGKNTLFVECGTDNAFEKRFDIYKNIDTLILKKNLKKDECLYMISLGPTASVVVEYISNLGFVAWDTGHLFQYAEKEIEKIKTT